MASIQPILGPFLMFQGKKAEEALNFYVQLVPDSHIESIKHWDAGEPGPEGTVKVANARIGGCHVMASDSYTKHAFDFTPSISLYVNLATEDEIERTANALAEGGSFLMPLGSYGFSKKFAWVSDRFGVSWQLNVDWKWDEIISMQSSCMMVSNGAFDMTVHESSGWLGVSISL
jgi:predicted 3-demethylubiquinone-9 3-methyltransferase (glyoxalase superfamily)